MNSLFEKFRKAPKNNVPRVIFAACGEVMIDALPFSFSVESAGAKSDKGLTVSISGDAVDNGEVTFSDLEYNEMKNGKITVVKMAFPLVTKVDGKKIYQAKFSRIFLPEYTTGAFFHKTTEAELIARVNSAMSFRVTPHYKGDDRPELMLTVYPNENPLGGSAAEWRNVTSDQDYFIHKFKQEK